MLGVETPARYVSGNHRSTAAIGCSMLGCRRLQDHNRMQIIVEKFSGSPLLATISRTKVEIVGTPPSHQQVLRLDVSVDDILQVKKTQPLNDLRFSLVHVLVSCAPIPV